MSIVTLCAIPDEVLIQGFWCLCSPLEEIIQQLHHILEGISEDAAHVAQHIHSGPPFQLLCTSNNMTAHLQHMITCRHLEHRRQTSCTVALHLHVAAADDVLIKPFVCRLLLLLHKQTPITCKYAAYTYTHKRFCKSFSEMHGSKLWTLHPHMSSLDNIDQTAPPLCPRSCSWRTKLCSQTP